RDASLYINGALHLDAREHDVVGAWADGAENSVMDVVENSNWDKLETSAAMKGWLADQKQVAIFQEQAGGDHVMYNFDATGKLEDIHKSLLQDGLAFHTLVPHDGGATVHVIDMDKSDATLQAVQKAAGRYGAKYQARFGRGEFPGTDQRENDPRPDREQRDDARRAYEEIIRRSSVPDSRAVFERVRDRWGQAHQVANASDLYDKYHDTTAQADDIVASVPGAREAVSAAESRLAGGTPTNAPVSKGGFVGPDGKYTADREALHQQILGKLFSSDAVKAATPATGEKPVMTVLGGRGGSGKSFFTKSGIADAAHAVYINADDIQAELPGYGGWNAALYHDEASDITKQADEIARDLHVSVIHDATMRTPGGTAKRVGEYKAAGYAVNGHYMFLPPQTSTKRAMERFVRGGSEGRYVPASVLLNNTTNERTFDSLKDGFNKWTIYENTGASPKLVAEGGVGEQEKRNGEYSTRQVRERSRSAGRRGHAIFAGLFEEAPGHGRPAQERTTEEIARARGPYRACAMDWFFERYNENHDPDNGQFASGDGGGGGGSVEPTAAAAAPAAGKSPSKRVPVADVKPAQTSTAAADKSEKRKAKLSDFEKAKINIDSSTLYSKDRVDRFIDTWDKKVGEDPETFKKSFTGGVNTTMSVKGGDSSWEITGSVLDENGSSIGHYTRIINWRDNSAESAYFKLNDAYEGKGEGKKMLAGNVAFYQKLGLDKVSVHANIDVGGYAWARYGYVPTRSSWRDLSADIRSKLGARDSRPGSGGGGGDTYTPGSWEELSDDEQESVKDVWMRDTKSEFVDSEIQNWRDNGGALDEAKYDLAHNGDKDDWATDTIDEFLEEREENGKPVPYSAEQIKGALGVDYETGNDGRDDPDISFDDKKLQEPNNQAKDQMTLPGIEAIDLAKNLTEDMRTELTERLTKAFNKQADRDEGDVEPPSYIGDDIGDYQDQHWDAMSERERFRWARDNGHLPEREVEDESFDSEFEQGDVEKDESSGDTLMKLASSNNPKALWAIADSPRGKELLLNSDWNGVLDFKDKETMDRFNAYVGKKKAA
ncbi:MAG TPA: zeta toxin family protein, partial [Candidatus Saccharimonadales bacterium]|nr:zeta toxin family protein [Candidatus Saccharimonadales bacterium]